MFHFLDIEMYNNNKLFNVKDYYLTTKKLLLFSLPFITLLGSLTISTNTYAKTYSSIEEAKKEFPNAVFKTDKNKGTFSFSYEKDNTKSIFNVNNHTSYQSTAYKINNQTTNQPNSVQLPSLRKSISNFTSNQFSKPLQSQNYTNDQSNSLINIDEFQTLTPSNLTSQRNNRANFMDAKKAYHKDKQGMITNIDMDEFYNELQIIEFNEKAKNNEGNPLAVGNGKIVEQPLFTNKNNLYSSGQCTWYVFDKRSKDGHTISTFWGDAKNWAGQASNTGFKVDHLSTKGSIMQTINGPYGHVAYVERVNKDGSIFISEMNWIAPYIVSTRTISSSEFGSYNFIH